MTFLTQNITGSDEVEIITTFGDFKGLSLAGVTTADANLYVRSSATGVTSAAISSSETVVLTTTESCIIVGSTVTGTGISGTVKVRAISDDGTTITLDTSSSIAKGITLTFRITVYIFKSVTIPTLEFTLSYLYLLSNSSIKSN